MKTLMMTLALLICILHLSCTIPVAPSVPKLGCCPRHSRTPIPKGRMSHVGVTPSDCGSNAILITTVCGQTRCIDPEWNWAKQVLEEFNKSSGAAPFNQSKCDKN